METSPDALIHDDPSVTVRAVKDITFGSIAGMISKVFEHPFDLTKVRLQAQVLDATARFKGPVDCLVKTWRNEGITGLYRGLPAPIVGAMAENASLFLSYSELQNLIRWATAQPLSQVLSLPQLALAGAGAGAITSFILTPVELVKCKMQVQMLAPLQTVGLPITTTTTHPASRILPGPIAVLTSTIRTTGFRGLWLGHTGTLIREGGGSAAWFATKEFVASLLVARRLGSSADLSQAIVDIGLDSNSPSPTSPKQKPSLLLWESALSGACAGAAFNLSMFPADSVKSAMQTEEELRPQAQAKLPLPPNGQSRHHHHRPRATFISTFKAMYKARGLRGLYAGCGITVARSIPSSAIIFLIYDGLSKGFG